MEAPHALKSLLQLQLASDASSVLHLSYVLEHLNREHFAPSPHLQKWTTRISSLLHSKDPGARWAGLCLAYKTSSLSKPTLIECAQSWVGVALPLLSKSEPIPTLKVAIRYLLHVFGAALDVPEFQRQLAMPNVPKFSTVLVSLADKHSNLEVKVLSIRTLTTLVPLFPTSHRSLTSALSSICLRILNGSAPPGTYDELLKSASKLYSVLHLTGGKVGAANLWRKSVDETLQFSWTAFLALRTTFPDQNYPVSHVGLASDDPLVCIPLNLDRLKCGVVALCDLLMTTTHRPVQVPVGSLMNFCLALLVCTADDQREGHVDPAVRVMEVAALQSMWKAGCNLVSCLAKAVRSHLTPNLSRLVVVISYHLEQKLTTQCRLNLLQTVNILLENCPPFHSQLGLTRLAKAVLPSVTALLSTETEAQQSDASSIKQSKKGKKRRREYEGDEVFKLSRAIACPTHEDEEVVLAALDVLRTILLNPHLSPSIHSLASRVLLSISLTLPLTPSSSISSHPAMHGHIQTKVAEMCTELGRGTTSAMSKSLGLVLSSVPIDGNAHDLKAISKLQRDVDLLLHPRGPPLVRSMPHLAALSLFRTEESHEETEVRESLGLSMEEENEVQESAEVEMAETEIQTNAPETSTQAVVSPVQPPISTPQGQPGFLRKQNVPLENRVPKNPGSHLTPPSLKPQPSAIPASSSISTSSQPTNNLVRPAPTLIEKPAPDPRAVQLQSVAMAVDDEDEEIPTIDMDSDSDG
ncbi:rRNA processing/ribosome biogenesis-domain-containing protein [Hygrophoropsis aurantiaca]|uniref:rRNA processing/ribosome biogenesis-domain-containing protein n=1 Tax=Hygrophoropsis aurantiaca TaxID=72124 RepID=A0ACB8AFC0_9AGAM|nr:rRNA processing/ribosome biogenesis-domain-containing protein [Hygrophoropsis aurantiaca]